MVGNNTARICVHLRRCHWNRQRCRFTHTLREERKTTTSDKLVCTKNLYLIIHRFSLCLLKLRLILQEMRIVKQKCHFMFCYALKRDILTQNTTMDEVDLFPTQKIMYTMCFFLLLSLACADKMRQLQREKYFLLAVGFQLFIYFLLKFDITYKLSYFDFYLTSFFFHSFHSSPLVSSLVHCHLMNALIESSRCDDSRGERKQ